MKNRKMLLPALLSIALVFSLIPPASVVGASAAVPLPDDHSIIHSTTDSSGLAPAIALNTPQGQVTPMVAAGAGHTVGLKADGTVVAIGDNSDGQCDVGDWTGIIQVAACDWHTVGVKADGTVVAVGRNWYGQCNVSGWTGIIQVAAGGAQTVGVKANGTVVAVGYNGHGRCDVGGWTDIVQVATGSGHTVGVKSDGIVVAVGYSDYGQCNVIRWRDIVQVAAGGEHTVGLKSDGTVVAKGQYNDGQCNVGDWTNIVQVAAGFDHTVGLMADGTVVAVGWNYYGQCDVGGWNLGEAAPSTPISFTTLVPPSITTTASTYDAELTASGTNFNNVNRVTFTWSGPDSGTDIWDKGDSDWNSKVTVSSDTAMTLRPRVLYNESATQPQTWTWTVTLRDTTGATASRSFTVTYILYEGQIPEQAATCPLPPPTLISPAQGAAEMALRPTFSWSSVSGANRYWLVVATDKNLLPTEPADEFCEVYYLPAQDGGQWGILYYPAYYNSIVVRLYNFDGKAVVPRESLVISYVEKVSAEGIVYKEITKALSFPTYEEAEDYVSSQEAGNYRIVSANPLSSPVPLEKLNSDVTSVPSAVISEIGLTSTSYTPPSNLDHGTTYWWQVQAFNWDGSKVVQLGQYSAQRSFTTEQEEVALTLYVHENSASGPLLSGARVTGQDGGGISFDKTTGSSGYVTITRIPGTWSFTVSKTGYSTNSWSQDITSTCTRHAYLAKDEQPKCAIRLETCQSGIYLSSDMPLCWEVGAVGIGETFSICIGDSTDDKSLKEVRFSSDDSQDGNPSGQWTQWYDWNVSSGDWSAQSKSMSWSCSTGGGKEIWVELKDNADQTSQCFADITVVRFDLPDVVSLDDIQISQRISSLVKYVGIDKSWPVFLKGTLPFGNIPINIVLICSENYPTEFKLVRIKTDLIEDPSDLSLSVVLPSSGVLECIETYVPRRFADWITNFGETLAKEILSEIAIMIAEIALDMGLPGIGFAFSVIDCVAGGYETTLEGWEIGEDYMVYLPMGVDMTIRVKRGLSCYAVTSPVLIGEYCPPPVHGQWTGSITERSTDIKIDIEEVDTDIFKLYSPAELRVYDSLGRVTGLVHGEIREEIPDSVYEPEIEVVAISSPADVYRCEVVGTEEGNYGLACASVKNGQTISFVVSNVSISTDTVHQYSIDWNTLSTGGPGITVRVDSDGDGIFEQTTAIQSPIASFVSSAIDPVVSEEVTFDASGSYDPDGEIVSYEWNFGDGNTSTGEIVTHAYSVPGEYLVSLVVVDNDGVVSTHSRTIQIGEVPDTPIWLWLIIAIGTVFLVVIIIRGIRRAVKA